MTTRENAALHKLYLITGGAGFIGVNVVRALIPVARGIRVLDDLSSGRAEDLPEHCLFSNPKSEQAS